MTSRSVWKPRFWFQIAFAELMGDTRELPETPRKILRTPKALLTLNLKEASPPLLVINFISKPYFVLSNVKVT